MFRLSLSLRRQTSEALPSLVRRLAAHNECSVLDLVERIGLSPPTRVPVAAVRRRPQAQAKLIELSKKVEDAKKTSPKGAA